MLQLLYSFWIFRNQRVEKSNSIPSLNAWIFEAVLAMVESRKLKNWLEANFEPRKTSQIFFSNLFIKRLSKFSFDVIFTSLINWFDKIFACFSKVKNCYLPIFEFPRFDHRKRGLKNSSINTKNALILHRFEENPVLLAVNGTDLNAFGWKKVQWEDRNH